MGLSSLWPLSSIEMYFSLVPSMDAALTWLTFAARLDCSGEKPRHAPGFPVGVLDLVGLSTYRRPADQR